MTLTNKSKLWLSYQIQLGGLAGVFGAMHTAKGIIKPGEVVVKAYPEKDNKKRIIKINAWSGPNKFYETVGFSRH